jgi:hypothetical protein
MHHSGDVTHDAMYQVDLQPIRARERDGDTSARRFQHADLAGPVVCHGVVQVALIVDQETEAKKSRLAAFSSITPGIAAAGPSNEMVIALFDGEQAEVFDELLRLIEVGCGESNVV